MIPDILYEEPGKGKGKELLSPFDELHLPDELPLPDEPPPSYESLASNASPPFDGQPPAYRGLSDELREKFSKAGITDNDLEILTSYETVFIVDDSSSMAWDRKVLWYEVCAELPELAAVATRYGKGGIGIYFINSEFEYNRKDFQCERAVKDLFSSVNPKGSSPIGAKLREATQGVLEQLEKGEKCKKTNYIVITDGRPTDDLGGAIRNISNRLKKAGATSTQIGIQIVQVGKDEQAGRSLKRLNFDLKYEYNIMDIVDIVPYEKYPFVPIPPFSSTQLVKIVLRAISRKIDKQDKKLEQGSSVTPAMRKS